MDRECCVLRYLIHIKGGYYFNKWRRKWQVLVRIQANWNSYALMMGLWNAVATMENIMVALQKINRTTMKVKAQSCLTLCDPVDCNLPGSSIHGIFQARILEWVAISFSRRSFPTQGSNQGLPHCRQTLYCLSHQNSTSGYITQRTESRDLKKYWYTHVHSSIIHNNQKVQTTQVSTDRWMGKENVVNTYSGILFSL